MGTIGGGRNEKAAIANCLEAIKQISPQQSRINILVVPSVWGQMKVLLNQSRRPIPWLFVVPGILFYRYRQWLRCFGFKVY